MVEYSLTRKHLSQLNNEAINMRNLQIYAKICSIGKQHRKLENFGIFEIYFINLNLNTDYESIINK